MLMKIMSQKKQSKNIALKIGAESWALLFYSKYSLRDIFSFYTHQIDKMMN